MPARLAFPWFYDQVLERSGAHQSIDVRMRIDALLGDEESDRKVREGELALVLAAGGEVEGR